MIPAVRGDRARRPAVLARDGRHEHGTRDRRLARFIQQPLADGDRPVTQILDQQRRWLRVEFEFIAHDDPERMIAQVAVPDATDHSARDRARVHVRHRRRKWHIIRPDRTHRCSPRA